MPANKLHVITYDHTTAFTERNVLSKTSHFSGKIFFLKSLIDVYIGQLTDRIIARIDFVNSFMN
jgi:hypothetical protein